MRRSGARSFARGCALLVVVSSAGLGCTTAAVDEPAEVEPLGRTAPAADQDPPVPPGAGSGGTSTSSVEPPEPEVGTRATPADVEAAGPALRDELDEALAAYDRALTALVGDPTAALDPLHPHRVAWERAVGPTAFSSEMLATIRRRFEQDRVVIRPDESGLAYRHHALEITRPLADTMSFTWCGHSPGIGHHADSGVVLDDGVAHARGTGTASRVDDRWRIDSLDEFDLTVLAPGAPDPCPAEVAAAEQGR